MSEKRDRLFGPYADGLSDGREETIVHRYFAKKREDPNVIWPDWGCKRKHTSYYAARNHEYGPGVWKVCETAAPIPYEGCSKVFRYVVLDADRYDAEALACFLNDFAPDVPYDPASYPDMKALV